MITNNEKLNYMDQYNCEAQSNNNFVCTAYQPDWSGDQESDSYPRFGTISFGITAGIIDTTSTDPIAWGEIRLMRATQLLAQTGIAALIAFSMF